MRTRQWRLSSASCRRAAWPQAERRRYAVFAPPHAAPRVCAAQPCQQSVRSAYAQRAYAAVADADVFFQLIRR